MAQGLNKVILIGNLGDVPDLRYMNSGDAACNFSLATSESWKDKNGEKQERTEWHRCSAFDRGNYKMAQYIAGSCQKGTKLYVEGQLQTRKYEKDGIERYTTEIKVNDFQVLSGGIPRDGQGQQGGYGAPQQAPQTPPAQPQSFTPDNPAGTPAQMPIGWGNGYAPTAKCNGGTLEQVWKKFKGDANSAIQGGYLAQSNVINDFDDDIPF